VICGAAICRPNAYNGSYNTITQTAWTSHKRTFTFSLLASFPKTTTALRDHQAVCADPHIRETFLNAYINLHGAWHVYQTFLSPRQRPNVVNPFPQYVCWYVYTFVAKQLLDKNAGASTITRNTRITLGLVVSSS
jgi:hypothetical protein